MNKEFKSALTKHMRFIQPKAAAVPLLIHTRIPDLPNKRTIEAEKEVIKDHRLFHHVAAMSDANKKKRILHPASSVAASESHIIPQLFDAAPNCGMRIIATDLTENDLTEAKMDELYETLVETIPARTYFGSSVPAKVIVNSFLYGSRPVAEYLKVRTEREIENTYEQGNMFAAVPKEYRLKSTAHLFKVLPPLLVWLSRFRLGILGATKSHFLTLMQVDDIHDQATSKRLGLKKGQYIFYLHTGSGIIGRYIGYMYSAQPRKFIQSLQLTLTKIGFFSSNYQKVKSYMKNTAKKPLGFTSGNLVSQMCVQALQSAGNQGFANRTMITHNLDLTLEKVFGRQVKLKLVYDAPHVLLSQEQHYGKKVWVHRNGTTRALGEKEFSANQTSLKGHGEPVLLAPFEHTYGYLAVAKDQNNTTFKSANHELGKLENTSHEAFGSINESDSANSVESHQVKIYTKTSAATIKTKSIHFSFATTIAKEIEQNNIASLVLRLRTIRTLTHSS